MNIIITNIGRRGYLVDYFKAALGAGGRVYSSDCDATASGLYGNCDGYFILPKPVDDEEKYVSTLINVCLKNNINAVIPIIDPEIYILSGYQERFAEAGIRVVVSDRRVLDICYDKLKMNAFLEECGFPTAQTFSTLDEFEAAYDKGLIKTPVIIKPILGSGSVETYIVEDIEKARALFKPGMIIQELLKGCEYGADVFNSFEGEPLRCVVKRKISMRSGETDKSISVHEPGIEASLKKLSKELKHVGNLDCDIILCDGRAYIIDMNPRFGGGYPATHAIGVDLAYILCQLLKGEIIRPEFGKYEEGILVMKEISIRSVKMKELLKQ
ncbi:MAG: ATP-grasp domain-containing protein [Ruminococcus sp.]|nr:ATP-grasp domain-containing protein [Ruminococcus sp.]